MKFDIRMYGDPVLREMGVPVEEASDEIRQLGKDMLDIMYQARGIGLAAQQIGKTIRICVVDVPTEIDVDADEQPQNPSVSMPMVLINPRIRHFSDEQESKEEGCLSFPEIAAPIIRSFEISLEYLDPSGKEQSLQVRGLLARAIQHEVDHLNGVLFIDRMTKVKKIALSGRLKRMRKQTEQKLAQASV